MKQDNGIPPVQTRPRRDGELHYHYDREEREATRQQIWSPPTGGFFRRNRALTIVLVDVIIVVLLFFIYLFFLQPLAGQTRIGPYRIRTDTFVTREDVLLAVTVFHTGDDTSPAPFQPVVTVRAAGEEVADLTPLPGRERTLALGLPRAAVENGEILAVTVTIGREKRDLQLHVSFD